MSGKIRYSDKNKLLLAGSILFCVILYWVTISRTIEAAIESDKMESQLLVARDAPVKIKELTSELNKYKTAIETVADHGNAEDFVLGHVSRISQKNKVSLASLSDSQKSEDKDYAIDTREIKLRGDFASCVKVMHELEKSRIGRISSARFVLEEDRKASRNYLYLYIYIQNVKPKGYESAK